MARWRDGVQILFAAIFYNGCCAFALFSVIDRISRLHARLHRRSGYNSASLGAGDDDGGGHSHYNYAPLNETHHHHQRDASSVAAYSARSSSASSAHPPGAAGGVALQQRPPSVDAGVQKLQVGARRGIGLASSRPFLWCSGGDVLHWRFAGRWCVCSSCGCWLLQNLAWRLAMYPLILLVCQLAGSILFFCNLTYAGDDDGGGGCTENPILQVEAMSKKRWRRRHREGATSKK
jgi:hypothetical protein